MYDTDVEVTYSVDLSPALVSEGEVQVYRYMRKQPGGGGCDCNYTAIKDTLSIDNWITNEIQIEGNYEFTEEDQAPTVAHIENAQKHTFSKDSLSAVIGSINTDLKKLEDWSFLTYTTDEDTGEEVVAPSGLYISGIVEQGEEEQEGDFLPIFFSESTQDYILFEYKDYSKPDSSIFASLKVYKTDFEEYKKGDVFFELSPEIMTQMGESITITVTYLKALTELSTESILFFTGLEIPEDITNATITVKGIFLQTDSQEDPLPEVEKTLTLRYSETLTEEVEMPGVRIFEGTDTDEEGNEYSLAAYISAGKNLPMFMPKNSICFANYGRRNIIKKLLSFETHGFSYATYLYENDSIKINSAIKLYVNDDKNIKIIDRQEGSIQLKRDIPADVSFNMEILDTDEEGLVTLFNSYKEPFPTRLSQFQNDTYYLTKDKISARTPIQIRSFGRDEIILRLDSGVGASFAQYSSTIRTGTLQVDKWVEKSGDYIYTINDYEIFNYETDVIMTVNSPVILEASDLTASKLELKAKSKPTEPISYSYKFLATNKKGQFTIVNTYIPAMPTKVSELENDSNFATTSDVPTKTSELTNDSNFAVTADIPTKTSELQNDSGYVTAAEVEDVQRIEAWKHSDSDKKATLTKAGTYQTFGEFPITENDSTINYKWYGEIYFDGTSATIGTSSNYNKFNSQTSQLTMVTATPTITADENGKMLLRVEILNYRIGESPVTATTDYIAFKYRKITNEDAVERKKIYGVDLVGSENPSALVRTDDAVGLNVTVHTSEITSDFDNCYPWSAIEEVTDDAGNVFVKIPKFYSKITKNADGTYKHQLSGKKHEGFSTLFVDGNGNEIDYVLVGKYEGSGSADRVYSKSSATVLREITLNNFRTACRANGAGYQQYDFLIDLIIKELWLVEMKTTNSQSIMYGYANNNLALIATGTTDTVKTSSGSPVSNSDGKHAMKYRGIENLWGNTVIWCDGISFSNEKVYVCTDPASYTAGKIDAPYVYQGDRAASYGYVKKVEPLGQNSLIQYVTEVGGSLTTYFCDESEVNYSADTPATALTVGGGLGAMMNPGLWGWKGHYPLDANSYIGGRLCYKPI